MGRKIPARKHHGVRDPLRQLADREALIKDKINHPPEKKDFQKVSHSLASFIKLKDDAKSGNGPVSLRKRKRTAVDEGADRPENYDRSEIANPKLKAASLAGHRNDKKLASIKRLPNEPDLDYLRRVNRITQASIAESQFESKYGVEVIRNEKTGEIKIKKRPADELEQHMKDAMLARRRGEIDEDGNSTAKKKRKDEPIKKLSKDEQRRLVKEALQAKRDEKAAAVSQVKDFKRDVVQFGEVVHAPPTLVTPRRAQKAETVPRPGSKKSLLLHNVIEPKTSEASDSESDSAEKPKAGKKAKKTPTAPAKPVDLKGKRKDLPVTTREMLEKQQQNAMDLYRQLKKTNRQNNIEM